MTLSAPMRIAFVKQDVYLDLYVHGRSGTPADLIFSSNARVGPVGLFTRLGADFLIVRECADSECRIWEKVIPHYRPEWFRDLQTKPVHATRLPEARFFSPGSPYAHDRFAVAVDEVDWAQYDIVIGINIAIPRRIVERHPGILWCYMIGEANVHMDEVVDGYDVCLNQETGGRVAARPGIVDFPYTFSGGDCLAQLMRGALQRESRRHGIFIEVNSLTERPAVRAPAHLLPLTATGHPLRLHRQNIRENLTELFDAKYFVKLGGRAIRGNSVIEAISCGTVVLMNPAELYHAQLLPRDAWIYSVEDACRKIATLEADPARLARLREAQQARVEGFAFEAPWESLRNCLAHKRAFPLRARPSGARAFAARCRRYANRVRAALTRF